MPAIEPDDPYSGIARAKLQTSRHRDVAIGIAGSGRVGTIALQECDRRAAGAIRGTSPPSSDESRSRGLTAPAATKRQSLRVATVSFKSIRAKALPIALILHSRE